MLFCSILKGFTGKKDIIRLFLSWWGCSGGWDAIRTRIASFSAIPIVLPTSVTHHNVFTEFRILDISTT